MSQVTPSKPGNMRAPGVTQNLVEPNQCYPEHRSSQLWIMLLSLFQPIFFSWKDKHIGKRSRRKKEKSNIEWQKDNPDLSFIFNSKLFPANFSFLERMSIKESLVRERKKKSNIEWQKHNPELSFIRLQKHLLSQEGFEASLDGRFHPGIGHPAWFLVHTHDPEAPARRLPIWLADTQGRQR
jgi:hypothetical protein